MNGLLSTRLSDSFPFPDDLSLFTSTTFLATSPCIASASLGRSKIHFFSSMSEKKSAKSLSSAESVDFEPMMINFFFARVKETLILRQSRSNSPIYRRASVLPIVLLQVTHATRVVGSHHRNDNAVLVPSLTLVGRQDLDRFHILQHG